MEPPDPVELEEASNSVEGAEQQADGDDLPIPPPGEEMLPVTVPPRGSGGGARLGFLLGMQQPVPPTTSRATQGGGLPPVASTGSGRKRSRTPVASSSDGDGPVQKKGKKAAGRKQAQKSKSPV